jgi:hypothetical protein
MEGRGFVPAHVVLREVLGDERRGPTPPTMCARPAETRAKTKAPGMVMRAEAVVDLLEMGAVSSTFESGRFCRRAPIPPPPNVDLTSGN